MKQLKDTVDLMLSDNWKDRLKAEIYQCQIRKNKLQTVLENLPKDDASYEMLQSQYVHMVDYLVDLQSRAAAFALELDSEFEREADDPMCECCCCQKSDSSSIADMLAFLIAMDIISENRGDNK